MSLHLRSRPALRFGPAEARLARAEWGLNCGPGALAAVLGIDLPTALRLLPEFARRRATTEVMMEGALREAGQPYTPRPGQLPQYGLVRVLWHGLWWDDPKPFARQYHSHWIGIDTDRDGAVEVFDINAIAHGGWIPFEEWHDHLVPWLLAGCEPTATGGYEVSESYLMDRAQLSLSVPLDLGHSGFAEI